MLAALDRTDKQQNTARWLCLPQLRGQGQGEEKTKVNIWQRIMLRDINGTPTKPFWLPPADCKCKKCGAPIRYVKSDIGCVRLAADPDMYIINPADGIVPGRRRYITRAGQIICGEPLPRGYAGCEVAYRIHDCADTDNSARAIVTVLNKQKIKRGNKK